MKIALKEKLDYRFFEKKSNELRGHIIDLSYQ